MLALRNVRAEIFSEMVDVDAVAELVHKQDVKELASKHEQIHQQRRAREAYEAEWKQRKRAYREANDALEKETVLEKTKPHAFPYTKYPKKMPDGVMTRDEAMTLCPLAGGSTRTT